MRTPKGEPVSADRSTDMRHPGTGFLPVLRSRLGSAGTRARTTRFPVASLLCTAAVAAAAIPSLVAPSPVYAAGCSNEQLRSENNSLALPGCRAFERVTPRFQNGFGSTEILGVASSGEEMITSSTSGFAGAESSFLGPFYKITRTGSGWQTRSISPPASQFTGRLFYSASADLSTSVWALRSPDESIYAQNLYRREPDGTFIKIGPMVPPSSESGPPANGQGFFLGAYNFVGASDDLSHVYFSIHNGLDNSVLWPGDTTASYTEGVQGFSIYEYSGVGNARPALVGVNTKGEVISDCGTFLGSPEFHELYNAVSASGDRAFFTAEGHDQPSCPETFKAPAVTEVNARLGGQETVAISEPTKQDCAECEPSAERKGAQFQGASEDGSKVFFTTTQELLPGAKSNNLFEFNFDSPRGRRVRRISTGAGEPEVLGVARISEDGSHVYFVARGVLSGADAEGDAPVEGQANLYVYALDAEHPAGAVSFVATLKKAMTEVEREAANEACEELGEPEREACIEGVTREFFAPNDEADWSPTDNRPVQATPDGRRFVFQSSAPLTADVSGEGPQIFEYDAPSEGLIRISRGQNGFPQGTTNANASVAFLNIQQYSGLLTPTEASTRLAISGDGSQVQFTSPAALTPANQAGVFSAYEYRSVGLISNGDVFSQSVGLERTSPAGISADGKNAFILSKDLLVAGQTDRQANVFDARQGGGFPAPANPLGCLGEACLQGAPPPPPEPPTAGSLAPSAGNGPETPAPPSSQKPLKRALKKCRQKTNQGARKRCEKQAHSKFKRPRHSAQVKGG